MQAQRNALNGLRNMADVTSLEFKQLTADIKRMDAAFLKSQGRRTGGRLGGIAKGAGAIAAGAHEVKPHIEHRMLSAVSLPSP